MWDDFGAEVEAAELASLDVDLEMAEMSASAAVGHAARAAGRCAHWGAVGYLPKPVYPAQQGLRPGELRCTDGCGRVFASDEQWYAAMEDA